jgi:hypothetical protein
MKELASRFLEITNGRITPTPDPFTNDPETRIFETGSMLRTVGGKRRNL